MEEIDIRLVKLTNGTEVIGKVVHISKSGITLEDPIQINYRNTNFAIPSVSATRYLQFANTRVVHFEPKDFLHIVGIIVGMERFYKYSLSNFQKNVDSAIDEELGSDAYDEQVDGDKSKQYKAFLERITTDSPLN